MTADLTNRQPLAGLMNMAQPARDASPIADLILRRVRLRRRGGVRCEINNFTRAAPGESEPCAAVAVIVNDGAAVA